MRWLAVLALLLGAVVAVSAPRAATVGAVRQDDDCMERPLGPVPAYSVVTRGDFAESNTEADGRVVAGGHARLTNAGVATKLPVDPSRVDLAVGGDLTLVNAGVNNGSVTYGGTITPAGFRVPNGTVTRAAPPFDLDALFDGLLIRSVSWAGLDNQGDVAFDGYALRLTGTDTTRNVFNLTAAEAERARALYLRVPDGATTLINVSGGSFVNHFEGGMFIWDEATDFVQVGNPAQNADLEARRRALLWNFPNESSVTLGPPGTAWQGSVLAPRAHVGLTYQHIFGSIAAESLSGTGEIGVNPPNPCLPDPTPCPTPSPTPTPTGTPTPTPTEIPTVSPTASPSPTLTPSPTPTPTVTPRPTPLPTPTPLPFVTPTPTPQEHAPNEPLGPGETPGRVIVEGADAQVDVCKKVMTPGNRAVDRRRVRAGQVVKFRIRVTNLGTDVADDVVVCDVVPRGLVFVRASVRVVYRRGRLCVVIPHLTGQREGFVWLRVSRTASGRLTNLAAVTSRVGGRRTNRAQVEVRPVRPSGGGVTG
ncbi:choice-of-anchor A family protein [Solirubrobacter sp. CPCC 204708]|uniref:Choice-of-anchor A family protein n=1 Tax=Solirubrobacter deserti TaxID=2282478 RepID=A0ABT4RV64_9ACTN|nr:choice-of-anchor A family protein [Solirubrobacter deserti]MBE2316227.1 choice-of-anchor A family protein [Solirubrobacter deserti]MDA0142477.1 choice-of-anchor A family protein [Solirubrobacter deserti]